MSIASYEDLQQKIDEWFDAYKWLEDSGSNVDVEELEADAHEIIKSATEFSLDLESLIPDAEQREVLEAFAKNETDRRDAEEDSWPDDPLDDYERERSYDANDDYMALDRFDG